MEDQKINSTYYDENDPEIIYLKDILGSYEQQQQQQ